MMLQVGVPHGGWSKPTKSEGLPVDISFEAMRNDPREDYPKRGFILDYHIVHATIR
jgi:hypothetical protein